MREATKLQWSWQNLDRIVDAAQQDQYAHDRSRTHMGASSEAKGKGTNHNSNGCCKKK